MSATVAPACGSRRQAATAEGSPAYASQAPAAGTAGLRRELSGAPCSLSENSGQCSGSSSSGGERHQQAMLVLQQHQVTSAFSFLLLILLVRCCSIRCWGVIGRNCPMISIFVLFVRLSVGIQLCVSLFFPCDGKHGRLQPVASRINRGQRVS